MAVQLISTINCYTGLSTDAKPLDVKGGSIFYETDTQVEYVYDAVSKTWRSKRSPAMETFEGRMNVCDYLEQIQSSLQMVIEVLQEKL